MSDQDHPDSPGSTVRDALQPWESFIASDGIRSMRTLSADDLAERLGLDPEMPLLELQENMELADAVRDVMRTWT